VDVLVSRLPTFPFTPEARLPTGCYSVCVGGGLFDASGVCHLTALLLSLVTLCPLLVLLCALPGGGHCALAADQ
jgi:hypothetical protein